jgi:hypothetical protein
MTTVEDRDRELEGDSLSGGGIDPRDVPQVISKHWPWAVPITCEPGRSRGLAGGLSRRLQPNRTVVHAELGYTLERHKEMDRVSEAFQSPVSLAPGDLQ